MRWACMNTRMEQVRERKIAIDNKTMAIEH